MIDLYITLWNELPFKIKIFFCAIGIATCGFCLSPFSIVSSFIFSADQQGGCQQRFFDESFKAIYLQHPYQQNLAIDQSMKRWESCQVKPTLLGQFEAVKENRSILFGKKD